MGAVGLTLTNHNGTNTVTMTKHDFYNTDNYPYHVTTKGNWSIWANGSGDCASIPTPKAQRGGCLAAAYGTMDYVRYMHGIKLY